MGGAVGKMEFKAQRQQASTSLLHFMLSGAFYFVLPSAKNSVEGEGSVGY